jgi:outer membrane protein OmpA-like peptidoglycan-associated protein
LLHCFCDGFGDGFGDGDDPVNLEPRFPFRPLRWTVAVALVLVALTACTPRPNPDPPVPPPAPGPPPPPGGGEEGTEPVSTGPPPRPHAEILAEARAHEQAAERFHVPVAEGAEPVPQEAPDNVPSAVLSGAPRPISELATGADGRPRKAVFLIDDLRFAPGEHGLTDETLRRLDGLVDRLRVEDGGFRIEVQGHTDSIGAEGWNRALALERAETVRAYLAQATGLGADRTAAVAVGSRSPVADNSTVAGRARNRRVTVLVLR